jgi:hypothetical protein
MCIAKCSSLGQRRIQQAAAVAHTKDNFLGHEGLFAFEALRRLHSRRLAGSALADTNKDTTTTSTDVTLSEPDIVNSAVMLNAGGSESRLKNVYVNYIIKL